jgi:hypothetical protein
LRAPRCLKIAGRLVIAGHQDVGKRLVVAHQHVEARLQPLDQIGLEQQRFGFGAGGDELHVRRLRDHPCDAVGMTAALRVVGHPLLQAARLADIENVAGLVHHPVDARLVGQVPDEGLDDLRALQTRRDAWALVPFHAGDIGHVSGQGSINSFLFVLVGISFFIDHAAVGWRRGFGGSCRGRIWRASHRAILSTSCAMRARECSPEIMTSGVSSMVYQALTKAYSPTPVTSGVSQARCWPPSSAIIWPVTERAPCR